MNNWIDLELNNIQVEQQFEEIYRLYRENENEWEAIWNLGVHVGLMAPEYVRKAWEIRNDLEKSSEILGSYLHVASNLTHKAVDKINKDLGKSSFLSKILYRIGARLIFLSSKR